MKEKLTAILELDLESLIAKASEGLIERGLYSPKNAPEKTVVISLDGKVHYNQSNDYSPDDLFCVEVDITPKDSDRIEKAVVLHKLYGEEDLKISKVKNVSMEALFDRYPNSDVAKVYMVVGDELVLLWKNIRSNIL